MKKIMKRAWEIYRTLEGNRLAKLSMALRMAWVEAKAAATQQLVNDGTEKQLEYAQIIVEKFSALTDAYIAESEKTVQRFINNPRRAGLVESKKEKMSRAKEILAAIRKLTVVEIIKVLKHDYYIDYKHCMCAIALTSCESVSADLKALASSLA